MIRAVLDANVLASGVLGYRWRAGAFLLIMSDHLMDEVKRTLADPFFTTRISSAERADALDALKHEAQLIEISVEIAGVAAHPEDDLVLATAVSAAAGYLVTGDKQLVRVSAHRGVAVIRPRGFLTVLKAWPSGKP